MLIRRRTWKIQIGVQRIQCWVTRSGIADSTHFNGAKNRHQTTHLVTSMVRPSHTIRTNHVRRRAVRAQLKVPLIEMAQNLATIRLDEPLEITVRHALSRCGGNTRLEIHIDSVRFRKGLGNRGRKIPRGIGKGLGNRRGVVYR
jgi:hypothetical protein